MSALYGKSETFVEYAVSLGASKSKAEQYYSTLKNIMWPEDLKLEDVEKVIAAGLDYLENTYVHLKDNNKIKLGDLISKHVDKLIKEELRED